MKRLESRKSYSWLWDGHVNPKNSRWLAENLEEMDQGVKRMMKLIEDDGDSFAKKADMYYRRRPELKSHVEEFYRMYRSLAERYDHLTAELRKNMSIPSDLQSQGSGLSEIGYELPPVSSLPSPDLRLARRRSGQQAAGFEYFLGGGSSIDNLHKEADDSYSMSDSDPDCDAYSVNNYSIISGNGEDQALRSRVVDLENELLEVKEKLIKLPHEEAVDGSFRSISSFDIKFDDELGIAKNGHPECEIPIPEVSLLVEELKRKVWESESEIDGLKKELESSRSVEKDRKMQDQVELAQKEAASWKTKFNSEKREVTKLQERLARLKTSLSDRDHEIRELKLAVSDAEEKIFPEKLEIKAEMSKLVQEHSRLEEHIREWESRGRALEEEIRKLKAEMLQAEERASAEIERLKEEIIQRDCHLRDLTQSFDAVKLENKVLGDKGEALESDISERDSQAIQMNRQMQQLQAKLDELVAASERDEAMAKELRLKVKELEIAVLEGAEEKREAIRQLCFSLEHYRSRYHKLCRAFSGHNKQLRHASAAY